MKLKGLWIHPRSRLPYHRSQRGGKTTLTPLPPDLPFDHPDFIAAWVAAAKKQEPPKPFAGGTIGSTWAAVLASEQAHSVSKAYRGILERHSKQIIAKAGDVKARAVQPKHVRADIASATDKSGRLKAWRFWASICKEKDWIDSDPSEDVKRPRQKTIGHPAWTLDEIAAFRAAYPLDTAPRKIMELCYWTGARIGDAMTIGPQHVTRDGVLAYVQSKTGNMAYAPWACAVPPHADPDDLAMCRAAVLPASHLTFLATEHGKARSSKSAGQKLAKAARAIGIHKSAHGLRKSRAVVLAQGGATTSQIGAWTGHTTLTEIAHYTTEMDRKAAVMGTVDERGKETSPAPNRNQARK